MKVFLEIIAPLGYDTTVIREHEIYMSHKENPDKAVRLWADQTDIDRIKSHRISAKVNASRDDWTLA
ncbi:MAG: hypothetical protein IKI77_12840 [Oscillospiraceae bacterium]|nr:hypothetical protein [Oscillospiraceae bacterium]